MEFRKAIEADITRIMDIIKQAQDDFKEAAIDQWQNNYPNYETIKNDINNGNSYIFLRDNVILGTVAVIFDGERTYNHIYDGEWISDGKYVVIHRMAVDSNYKGTGLASIILKNIENICLEKDTYSIKVDTHIENISMQKFLQKTEFSYCGVIYLEDKSKRIAFEKILEVKDMKNNDE